MKKYDQGYSFIELIIVICVIIILGAITWPFYKNYMKRYHYKPIVQALEPIKTAISDCYEKFETLSHCDGGQHHIPANLIKPQGPIASLTIKAGVITVTPVAYDGIHMTDTYILTPVIHDHTLSWVSSGMGVVNGYAD